MIPISWFRKNFKTRGLEQLRTRNFSAVFVLATSSHKWNKPLSPVQTREKTWENLYSHGFAAIHGCRKTNTYFYLTVIIGNFGDFNFKPTNGINRFSAWRWIFCFLCFLKLQKKKFDFHVYVIPKGQIQRNRHQLLQDKTSTGEVCDFTCLRFYTISFLSLYWKVIIFRPKEKRKQKKSEIFWKSSGYFFTVNAKEYSGWRGWNTIIEQTTWSLWHGNEVVTWKRSWLMFVLSLSISKPWSPRKGPWSRHTYPLL